MTARSARNGVGGVVISAVWVIGLSVLAKVLGILKDVVVASRFGTSAAMDAFLVASGVPLLLTAWLRSPIRSGFVPLFMESLEERGERESWRAAGVVLGNLLFVMTVLTVVVVVLAPWIVSLIAPGFGPEARALTVSLARVMAATIIFAALAGTMTDLLHCYGNFAVPGLVRPVGNVILIAAAVLLAERFGIRGLAYGMLVGSVASVAIQWRVVWLHRADVKLGFDLKHPMFIGVVRLAFPLLIGMAGAKLDVVIDRIFASMLSEGSISGLSYALRLIDLPREIIVFGLATVLFPLFSRMVAKGRMDEFADRLIDSLRISFFLLLPVSIGLALLGEPFVRLVFQRGAFGEQSVRFTVSALLLYTPTVWALGLTAAMISGFVAMKDTKTPVIAGFLRLGVKVALVFAFIRAFEHSGIALATSISHVFKLVLFLAMLPAHVRRGRYAAMFRGFAGTAGAAAIMGVALYLLIPVLAPIGRAGTLAGRAGFVLAAAAVATGVYAAASRVLARRELAETLSAMTQGVKSILRRGTDVPFDNSSE